MGGGNGRIWGGAGEEEGGVIMQNFKKIKQKIFLKHSVKYLTAVVCVLSSVSPKEPCAEVTVYVPAFRIKCQLCFWS